MNIKYNISSAEADFPMPVSSSTQISAILKARHTKFDMKVSVYHTLLKYLLPRLPFRQIKYSNSISVQGICLSSLLECNFRYLFYFEIHLPFFFWFVYCFHCCFCFTSFYCCRLYSLRLLSCVLCLCPICLTKFCTFFPINFINLR